MDSLYIVMPAYNEEKNIEDVVDKWYPILNGKSEQSRLVIADSGSNDNTHTILIELKNKYPKLEIISDTNRYHGPKLMALYEYAIKNNIDYVFQTDSDGQTNPDEFNSFWRLRKKYDGIFGNRKNRKDGYIRVLVERVVCFLLLIYFKVKIPDANAPFRLMKCSVLKKYMQRIPKDYNLPNIIITTFFVFYSEKTSFKTISFKPRILGKNYINIRRIVEIGFKALFDFRRFKKICNGSKSFL